jgi:hypothetical protein
VKKPLYFAKNIFTVIGLVMVWRGVWYFLDSFDFFYLSGNHFWSGVFGIAIGLAMLYFPDKDLKEIEKL